MSIKTYTLKVPFYFVLFLFGMNTVLAQTTLSGTVKDLSGLPLTGATVALKGSNTYAVADSSGNFRLSGIRKFPLTLNVNYIGYIPQEIVVQETQLNVPLAIVLAEDNVLSEIVITSRRRKESAQAVPIPISVIGGRAVEESGSFNVNRVKELVPTVQLYSSNPRNTTLNIRGLGSTFGLTNDGIDPGVGFYIDGVYYARPAVTAFDFVDIEQIEVLRGPQGTLFGKNTTAGAFNITTRAPSAKPGATFELSYGNYGFIQAKASLTGPLGKKLAARISFSGTQRDGLIYNQRTDKYINDLNNIGLRGQLRYTPNDKVNITLAGDFATQRPDGYAQVVAGVAPTKRAAYRQFDQIISDLEYRLPSTNAFDRIVDHDTPWRSNNDQGGASLNADIKLGPGTLTLTSAWRYWIWGPSNDRDFTGLPVLSLSQAPSKHRQLSQEIRYAGQLSSKINGVIGVYVIGQNLITDPYHTEESGSAQWRFSQSSTSDLWKTPGLLDGYGIRTTSELNTFSGAVFGQIDWEFLPDFHALPGLRYNTDRKDVTFNRQTYGGLETSDPQLLALKRAVYTDQTFTANVEEGNFSGQFTLAYKPGTRINAFATISSSFKPVGVNLGGLPTANGQVLLDLARIKPERVIHWEAGIKTSPTTNSTLNLVFHHTDIYDFQTQVQTAEVGVNRGYLANAEQVRVWGLELDGNIKFGKLFALNGALAYTDGKYVSFTNAPVPLEETGGASAFKDISGGRLPGISKWAGSLGGELTLPGVFAGEAGKFFLASEAFYRSEFSSSPSPSAFLNIEGYTLLNARLGFRSNNGLSVFLWSRNVLNTDYYEQLLPAAGNAGHYAGVLGDPRTFGVTLRYAY